MLLVAENLMDIGRKKKLNFVALLLHRFRTDTPITPRPNLDHFTPRRGDRTRISHLRDRPVGGRPVSRIDVKATAQQSLIVPVKSSVKATVPMYRSAQDALL